MAAWEVFGKKYDTEYRPYEHHYSTLYGIKLLLYGEIDGYDLKSSCNVYGRLPRIVSMLDEYRAAYHRFMEDDGIENDISLDNARKRLRDGLGAGKKETYIYSITCLPYSNAHFPEDLDFRCRTREYAKLINRLTFNRAKHNREKVIKALDEIEALCLKYLNHANDTIGKYNPSGGIFGLFGSSRGYNGSGIEYHRSLR
jgi:hypothetical protein